MLQSDGGLRVVSRLVHVQAVTKHRPHTGTTPDLDLTSLRCQHPPQPPTDRCRTPPVASLCLRQRSESSMLCHLSWSSLGCRCRSLPQPPTGRCRTPPSTSCCLLQMNRSSNLCRLCWSSLGRHCRSPPQPPTCCCHKPLKTSRCLQQKSGSSKLCHLGWSSLGCHCRWMPRPPTGCCHKPLKASCCLWGTSGISRRKLSILVKKGKNKPTMKTIYAMQVRTKNHKCTYRARALYAGWHVKHK